MSSQDLLYLLKRACQRWNSQPVVLSQPVVTNNHTMNLLYVLLLRISPKIEPIRRKQGQFRRAISKQNMMRNRVRHGLFQSPLPLSSRNLSLQSPHLSTCCNLRWLDRVHLPKIHPFNRPLLSKTRYRPILLILARQISKTTNKSTPRTRFLSAPSSLSKVSSKETDLMTQSLTCKKRLVTKQSKKEILKISQGCWTRISGESKGPRLRL